MKTNIFSILFLISALFQLNAQTLNKEITKEGKKPFLLGKIDKSGLQGENYSGWFNKNHEDYQPNTNITNAIASELRTYEIKLFMGTWCGDSKQEVPRLYKILETCNFPMDQLTVIAVSREPNKYKQSPQHEEVGLNIHRVPTVIFYKNGKEINRIVEHPVKTFEEDIQNIITKNDYKSHYQIVAVVDAILNKKGTKGLKRKHKKILKNYKAQVTSMSELNTYAHVLYSSNKIDEALAVFKLNTKLFPEEPRTFMSLANTLAINKKIEEAIKVLEEAIKIHPENKNLKENLNVIKSN